MLWVANNNLVKYKHTYPPFSHHVLLIEFLVQLFTHRDFELYGNGL